MKLIIVEFKAFDRTLKKAYLDKSFEKIHEDLYGRCYTYEIIKAECVDLLDIELIDITEKLKNI